jgi:hypothetical protein
MKPNILELVDVGFHSSTQPTHFLILDFIKSSILNKISDIFQATSTYWFNLLE